VRSKARGAILAKKRRILEKVPGFEQQLTQLRQRMAQIDQKYADLPVPPRGSAAEIDARTFVEEWCEGHVVVNEHGPHFQMERHYEAHRHHGAADIGALCELPETLLDALGAGEIPASPPQRWAFLDTETTGLAGGSGTYAFLIGVGRITSDGFRVRQFFMREYCEEKSLLTALTAHLQEFDTLITYNGKTYDQPLLETRYRMNRQPPPFGRMQHLDLLHGARRLWKLRFESCRLIQLEQQILGFEREGDLPGEMIPYVYFEYLRSKQAQRLVPIFHHNAIDILTLGCLTAIVPSAFRETDSVSLQRLGLRRGEEMLGIARWLLAAGEMERALALFKQAVDLGLRDELLFRTLWDLAALEKRLERPAAALQILTELAACRNAFRVRALEELAKYFEHTERNVALALEFTLQALEYGPSEELTRRRLRLEKRAKAPKSKRLFKQI
jgi:hypothetical protein